MNEPDISPLAKRLAEENNVRWQELKGSGAGGKVVERDVLEYLARVMAGEEALDPTPEPVPEGMEAWPEEDVAAYRRGMAGDLVDEDSARAQKPGTPSPDDLDIGAYDDDDDTGLISEDIFLFDEPETSVGSDQMVGGEEDDLLIAGDDALTADRSGFEHEVGTDDVDEIADLDLTVSTDIEEDDTALFAAGDASRTEDDVELFAAPDSTPAPVRGGYLGDEQADPDEAAIDAGFDPSAPEAGSEQADEFAPSGIQLEVPEDDLDLDVAVGEDTLDEDTSDEDTLDEDAFDEDAFVRAGHADGFETDSAVGDPTAGRSEAATTDVRLDDEDAYDVGDLDDTFHHDEVAAESAVDGSALDGLGEPGRLAAAAAADLGVGDEIDLPDTEDAAPSSAVGIADLPLVSHGILLRRHIDLTSLAAAQLAVGREIDHGDPIAPTSFLVRAAAKAQDKVPLGEGHVGVAQFAGGFGIYAVEDASTMPYADLWRALDGRDADNDDVSGLALVVADMSELDVDEAVLHLGVPVLTLGRILYDNHQGSYRSTLSLAGDVAPEQGARFLARVAELLDAPVQLVL